jgi:hypothetical protein
MADCALILSKTIPEFVEDLSTQMTMFETLYNMNETIVCADETVIEWTKQKERRKGFAKFVMELCIRGLVSEDIVQKGLENVMNEISALVLLPKTEQNDENIHQFVAFLFETAKLIPKTKPSLESYLKNSISTTLSTAKVQMKTKFRA